MKRTGKNNPALEPTKIPTAIDIAWAAGVYEGEGHCRSGSHSPFGIMVSLGQKDPELLYWLRDLFGGSVRFAQCKTIPAEHQSYSWDVCGDRARLFLARIYPFLTARRRSQVDAIPALVFLKGCSPQGLCLEELKSKLRVFYEEHVAEMKQKRADRDKWNHPKRVEARNRRQAEQINVVPITQGKVS